MHSLKEMMRHPSHELSELGRHVPKRPMSIFGAVVLVLGVLGFYWLYPEIRRYIRIERM